MTSFLQTYLHIDGYQLVSFISIFVSILSLFCEAFIIFTYMRFHQLRPLMCWLHPSLGHFCDMYIKWTARYCKHLRFTERFPLYLHITIANALRDFAKILGFARNYPPLCIFQAFAINYGGLSTFWWIATVGSVLYSAIFYPKVWRHNHRLLYKREQLMIAFNYGIPFLLSLLPLFTDSYGNIGTHCWIKDTKHSDHIWRWLCFYIHCIFVTVYCVFIYYIIGKHVKDQEFGTLFQRIRWYPICLIFGFGFPLIHHLELFNIFIDLGIFGQIIHVLSTGLFGVFIFVFVGRSRGSFQLTSVNDTHDHDHLTSEDKTNPNNSDGFRAAIFGLSDGLATNLCLILGVQFAQDIVTNAQIITSGIAGLFGGAISMAIGEYVSVTAQSDAAKNEINKHRIKLQKEWNSQMVQLRKELIPILSRKTIECIVEDLKKSKGDEDKFENVLGFYCKLVLGVDPDETGNGYKSAMYSFGMFSFGACIPLSPYFFFGSNTAWVMAIITSLMIAIVIGSTIAYFSHSDQLQAMRRQFLATVVGVGLSITISKVFNAW